MKFTETKLKGAFIIEAKKMEDERGYFSRVWCKKEFKEHGLVSDTVQANISYNKKKGTLRGMHYQVAPFAESKTVRCITGAIYDVIIDLRPDSPTYKEWIGVDLDAGTESDSFTMLYVPQGFAHGFITMKDETTVHYMVTEYYTPGAEGGIKFDDPAFNIQWPMKPTVISDKDRDRPLFESSFSLIK